MTKYHVNPKTNRPNICRADKQGCPLQAQGAPHFDSKEDAKSYAESAMAKENDTFVSKKKDSEQNVNKYSFLSDFKKLEEEFEENHEGIPNRFYNYDLQGKNLIAFYGSNDAENMDMSNVYVDQNRLLTRLFQATSAPKDSAISDEKAMETFKQLGLENVEKLTDEKTLRSLKSGRAWVVKQEVDGKTQQAIISEKKFGHQFSRYNFRGRPSDPALEHGTFVNVDLRTAVGAVRAEKLTKMPVFKEALINGTKKGAEIDVQKAAVLYNYMALEKEQRESLDFKARQKYVKESQSKVATVWKDKKNPKESHVIAAKESVLGKDFKDVEIDSDVDLEKFKEFEKDYAEVRDKLPKIPEDKKPRIAFRKLGKHSSHKTTVTGLYSPAHNAIAISVEDSGSTVHEMAHMYDFALKDNVSMKGDFKDIQQEYASSIKMPSGSEDKADYYKSSHEVFARSFELYAHQKLGIDNRLVKKEKFSGFDYAPIENNPKLKEKTFKFFDNLFDKN